MIRKFPFNWIKEFSIVPKYLSKNFLLSDRKYNIKSFHSIIYSSIWTSFQIYLFMPKVENVVFPRKFSTFHSHHLFYNHCHLTGKKKNFSHCFFNAKNININLKWKMQKKKWKNIIKLFIVRVMSEKCFSIFSFNLDEWMNKLIPKKERYSKSRKQKREILFNILCNEIEL